jgi:hypothetical protein
VHTLPQGVQPEVLGDTDALAMALRNPEADCMDAELGLPVELWVWDTTSEVVADACTDAVRDADGEVVGVSACVALLLGDASGLALSEVKMLGESGEDALSDELGLGVRETLKDVLLVAEALLAAVARETGELVIVAETKLLREPRGDALALDALELDGPDVRAALPHAVPLVETVAERTMLRVVHGVTLRE